MYVLLCDKSVGNLEIKVDFVYFLGHAFLTKHIGFTRVFVRFRFGGNVCMYTFSMYLYVRSWAVYIPYYVNDINAGTLNHQKIIVNNSCFPTLKQNC